MLRIRLFSLLKSFHLYICCSLSHNNLSRNLDLKNGIDSEVVETYEYVDTFLDASHLSEVRIIK